MTWAKQQAIAVGDKNSSGVRNKICPNIFHLPKYDTMLSLSKNLVTL